MNRYTIITGMCYAISTPLGVHIGYQMGLGNWTYVIIETAALMVVHIIAPMFWIKAQTHELKE